MAPSRELLLHLLSEAAELEHNLMCTYLYAAFSLKSADELPPEHAPMVASWRQTLISVATEEMAHLANVWNITSALGGTPRFGRTNFPLDAGFLPASIVVKLAPFSRAVVQHFIHLERPASSNEREGEGFEADFKYGRGTDRDRITPMAMDYETVGAFYQRLEDGLRAFHEAHGADAFVGDPALQLGPSEMPLAGVAPVKCLPTALAALDAIVAQGEGAPEHSETSHFTRFARVREELDALHAKVPDLHVAHPAATNPVLRPPPRPEGRVWLEDEEAALTVDVANTCYAVMLRLLGYAYALPAGAEKGLAIELAISLMRAMTLLGERAARLPAGPSNPHCNAGMSFTALRDASPLPAGAGARRFFIERLGELAAHAKKLRATDERATRAQRVLEEVAARAARAFPATAKLPVVTSTAAPAAPTGAPPTPTTHDGIDEIEGVDMTLVYEGVKCIHSRHCVTEAPSVFLANVVGPWIHPDAMPVDRLVEIAHECPSGAIRYRRKDGKPDEQAPPVNLVRIREGGPYAVRADLDLDGFTIGFRATLCRCGASKHKPFCDGSHHEIHFDASGEPATLADKSEMLAVRNGPLAITPTTDGPLAVRGNLEIVSGTGRMVARVQSAKLCRCGHSATKPFCDGTHQKIGFRSDR
ncbi:MAG: CDGSH iron-sulfur domain-containing protein [Deltaproteobacteria bacterium]|nr:CDGSH iron-sulfur domain-containing protein [Deltaproteobacteria bacterium]